MSNAFLAAASPKGKSVKLPSVGSSFTGIISGPVSEVQETEYQPGGGGAPKFYPKSGQPIMQQVVPLDDVTAPSKEEAASTLYVSKPRMRAAIGRALQEAGVGDLTIGGTLYIERIADAVGKNPSAPPQDFVARYQPPAAPAANWGGSAE